jgi:RimJ/RimL family protein N-acetyltransferase
MKYKIPLEIKTERLILRYFKEEDWQDLSAYYSDPECMQYTAGRAQADWEVWRKVATMMGHWQIRGYGPYAMEEKSTGKVLGPVGLWYPLEWPEPEIKWGLAKKYWGQGYAREAALAVLEMAAEHLPDLNLISLISTGNVNSIKLAESLGASYEKTVPFRDSEASIYRHVKG